MVTRFEFPTSKPFCALFVLPYQSPRSDSVVMIGSRVPEENTELPPSVIEIPEAPAVGVAVGGDVGECVG